MQTKSQTRFATVLIAIVATTSVACDAQSPQAQFNVSDLVYSVDISNDGTLVAAGSRGDNDSLTVFDVKRGVKVWSVNGGAWVWDVAFSPNQKWLVSGSDAGLKIWDVKGGRAPAVLSPPPNSLPEVKHFSGSPEVKHLSVSPQGKYLAASRGSKIELWDFAQRKMLRFIPTTGGGAFAFSPDEKWLAVAGYHNRLKIHDVETGAQLGEVHAQIGILTSVDFSSDGQTLVACSEGVTKIFSLETSSNDVGLSIALSEVAALRSGLGCDISANGKWVASGGYSGKVSINEMPNGDPIAIFPVAGGRDSVYDAKFSADNTQLIVGGMLGKGPAGRGTIQIWNVSDVLD